MLTDQLDDPNDPLGVRTKKKATTQAAPSGDDPLGVRSKKKDSGSSPSSTGGLDISPAANYRESIKLYGDKNVQLQGSEKNLTALKAQIDRYDIMQRDPQKVEEFQTLNKQYNDSVKSHNTSLKELKNLKVILDQGKESYRYDNSVRQDKLFKNMGLSKQETQQFKNKIYKQQHPEKAKEVDSGRLIPNIDDVDADDLAMALTGKSESELRRLKTIDDNRSITDRTFGTFTRSVEKTLAFEMPAAIAGTIQNLLADVKIKPEDLKKSSFSPGIGHQIKKAINLIPGAKDAINSQVDDARVAAFEFADAIQKAESISIPGPTGAISTFKNDHKLIRSISQIERPLDVIDFVFSNAGQGVAQILPAALTRGASSFVQEIGNNQIEGTQAIAEAMTKKEGRLVTPEEVIRRDLDESVTARNYGLIQGAFESLQASKVVKMLGYNSLKQDLKEKAGHWFKELAKSSLEEGFTEGTQGALQQVSTMQMTGLGKIAAVKNIDWFQVMDEALAGMTGTATMGGGGMAANAAASKMGIVKDLIFKPNPTVEDVEVLNEFQESVIDIARKYGDTRPPEEIIEFLNKDVMGQVQVPRTAPITEPVAPVEEIEQVEEVAPPVEETLPEPPAPAAEIPVAETPAPQVDPVEMEAQEEIAEEQLLDEQQIDEAEPYLKVNSPVELAQLYRDEIRNPTGMSGQETAIANGLSGRKVTEASILETIGDQADIGASMAKSYLNKKGSAIDQLAQEISMSFNPEGDGTDISPEDIWNFMKKKPNGANTVFQPSGNDILKKIGDRYLEVTGKAINKRIANILVEKDAQGQKEALAAIAKPFDLTSDKDLDVIADFHVAENPEWDTKMELQEAMQSVLDNGVTVETLQNPAIQEYLNSDMFTAKEKENINYIFDYVKNTKAGSETVNRFIAERNAGFDPTVQGGQRVPGIRKSIEIEEVTTERHRQATELNEHGYPASWDIPSSKPAPAKVIKKVAPKPKAAPVQAKPIAAPVVTKIKKSDKVKAELDALSKELNDLLGGTLNSGVNPQAAVIGAKIVAKYMELGVVKFSEIAKDVYAEHGEEIFRKFFQAIKGGYASILATSEDENLTSFAELKKFQADDFVELITEDNESSTPRDLEPDSQRNEPDQQVGTQDVPAIGEPDRPSVGKGVRANVRRKERSDSSASFSERIPAVSSVQPDNGVDLKVEATPIAERIGRGDIDPGSGATNDPGVQPIPNTAEEPTKNTGVEIGKGLSFEDKIAAQAKANKDVKVIPYDKANIAESMPLLMPHQVENVYKAEKRLLNPPSTPDGLNKGILFTDGTGTGKTFSGLGIIKRMERMGTKDILIVAPTDAMVKTWSEAGKLFGLDIKQLGSTKDGGNPGTMVITTYANFRQNEALQERANKKPFGMVMYDESHKIVSNQGGDATSADLAHKTLTNAPNQAWLKIKAKYQAQWDKVYNTETGTYRDQVALQELIDKEAKELADKTKVVFLSASPFSYHKNLLYADGYLFKIAQGESNNRPGDSFKNFFVSNFGYRIRYNKLTEPEADVDVGLMERAFHSKLTKQGAISSTRLKLDKDYSREFVLIDDKMGAMIDEGYMAASDGEKYEYLPGVINKKFDFLYKSQLLEGIKAKRSVERIQQHLDMGRKIVVFHSYNHSLPSHPFDLTDPGIYPKDVPYQKVDAEVEAFHIENPQYKSLDLRDLKNPILTMQEAFGKKVVTFNGNVSAGDRKKAIAAFNSDTSGVDIIVVQMEAGKEGISLHDITGSQQRVMMNLGLPVKPTDAIQTEGRIYRIGQMSDAIVEYPVLHLNFEKIAFANKINTRVSTAENLAFGDQSRNLKEAFKEGYKSPITDDPNYKQGIGGRESDLDYEETDAYDFAKTLYFSRQKRNAKTKAREGVDYFATPEPLGFKMAEWLFPEPNQSLMEPSAGHGAIARFFPETTKNRFIEPSFELRADLSINVNGEVTGGSFEDHHIINKYDRIAMNPPFGHAGKTAWDHTFKAMGHLKDGGRLIAILPEGPSMQKYIDKWQESADSKDFYITTKIKLPSVTFQRAGTSVNGQLLVIDFQQNKDVQALMPLRRDLDLTHHDSMKTLFEELKEISLSAPLKPMSKMQVIEAVYADTNAAAPKITGDIAQVVPGVHTKYGYKIWTVRMLKNMDRPDYDKALIRSKSTGGYYSAFTGNNAIKGFVFKGDQGAANAAALVNYIHGGFTDGPASTPNEMPDTYNLLSNKARSRTDLAEFETVTLNNEDGKPFKMFDEVIQLAEKYSDGTIGQGQGDRGAVGTFYRKTGNIRVKGLNDLSVAMHELVHAVDKRNNVIEDFIAATKDGDKTRKRLTDLYLQYYPKAQPGHDLRIRMVEGFATLVQKYLESPTDIKNNYQDLIDAFLTPGGPYWKNDTGNFVQDVSKIVAKYQKLAPLAKMGARITHDVIDPVDQSKFTKADKFTTELFDRLWPIEKLAKKMGTHFTSEDVSLWMRMSNNALQLADNNISSKAQKFWQMDDKGQFVKKHDFNYYTLTKSLDKRKLQDEFAAYLYARRLKFEHDELQELDDKLQDLSSPQYLADIMQDMNVGAAAAAKIVQAQIDDVQAEFNKLHDILENEGVTKDEANEAFDAGKDMFATDEKMYDTLVAEDLEFAHNPLVQLLDKEGMAKFSARKGYASFKRATYDELVGTTNVPAIATSGKTKVSAFLTRRGSTRPVLNPLMGAMMNHAELMRKGLKQMVYNKFLGMVEANPDLFQVQALQVNQEATNRYPQEKDKNIIMARKDYKRVPILSDSEIKQVLDENYDYHNAHLLERVGVNMSQLFRTGTTGIFWQFFINNVFMDQVTAGVNTRNGMIPFISSVRQMGPIAMRAITRGSLFANSQEAAYLKEYLFLAGSSQTFLSADIEGVKQVRKIIKGEDKNWKHKVSRYLEHILKILGTPGNATEIMTRGTEYILARKAGKSQQVAQEEAGRVSAPFHHMGRFGGGVGRSYVRSVPYFNASLQVLKQTKVTLNTREGKVRYAFAALSMAAMAAGSTLYMMSGDDEDDERVQLLKSLPPDNLTKYLYFPNPFSKKKLMQIRVPENLSWLAGMVNMMVLEGAGATKYDWTEYGEASFSFLPTQVNPFNPTQMLFSYLPQGIKPTVEQLTGVKIYPSVRPIETQGDLSNIPELRYNKYNSPGAIALGELAGWSPKRIDSFLEGTFGRSIKYLTGKPGAYGVSTIFERDLYLEASRQIQNYFEVKKRVAQQMKAHTEERKVYSPEELDKMYRQEDLVFEIEGALEAYGEIDPDDVTQEGIATSIRNDIFKRAMELEALEY
ncbi:MAG: DEAD/DEAH box helicase family protein [Chryseolinea sp.]